jgi:hypothetical protein
MALLSEPGPAGELVPARGLVSAWGLLAPNPVSV